jgi:hypothetical protein
MQLARAFNFDGKGNLTTPLVAQDSTEAKQVAKDYIIAKTKFASATEKSHFEPRPTRMRRIT